MSAEKRTCKTCKAVKPLDIEHFRIRPSRRDPSVTWFERQCRECQATYDRERARERRARERRNGPMKDEGGVNLFLVDPQPGEDRLRALAACAGTPTWFRDEDQTTREGRRAVHERKLICSECPVINECRTLIDALESALPNRAGSAYRGAPGVWAGETPRERFFRRRDERDRVRRVAARAA